MLSLSAQAKDNCYFLKEVMSDSRVGESKICKAKDLKNFCTFTSDEGWYTHTFQVPCKQFHALERKVNLDNKVSKK
jgi:hypothetical protein